MGVIADPFRQPFRNNFTKSVKTCTQLSLRDDSLCGKTFGSPPTITDRMSSVPASLSSWRPIWCDLRCHAGGTLAALQRLADADEEFLFSQRHHSLLGDGLLLSEC